MAEDPWLAAMLSAVNPLLDDSDVLTLSPAAQRAAEKAAWGDEEEEEDEAGSGGGGDAVPSIETYVQNPEGMFVRY